MTGFAGKWSLKENFHFQSFINDHTIIRVPLKNLTLVVPISNVIISYHVINYKCPHIWMYGSRGCASYKLAIRIWDHSSFIRVDKTYISKIERKLGRGPVIYSSELAHLMWSFCAKMAISMLLTIVASIFNKIEKLHQI